MIFLTLVTSSAHAIKLNYPLDDACMAEEGSCLMMHGDHGHVNAGEASIGKDSIPVFSGKPGTLVTFFTFFLP